MLKFYNTLTRKKEAFKPIHERWVGLYTCGPTVYNYAHIGNLRAMVFYDLVRRYLEYKGFKVRHVMNITDVDDKTIRDSQKEGKTLKEFTRFYEKEFKADLEMLNIKLADEMPRATDCVKEMVLMVEKLLDKGLAYKAKDGIYYDIDKFKDYGKLAKIKKEELKSGARVQTDEYDKESAQDFALWKFWDEDDGDVYWETELGKGRPGWHIECSAMSTDALGATFDIHCGGVDLVFPHHTNEIAQSEGATGKKFVNYWLHNEHLLVEGKKMSKSLGNFYTLRDILGKGYEPVAVRYVLLATHYRQQLNFTFEGLEAAGNSLKRLNEFIVRLRNSDGQDEISVSKAEKGFEKAMDDDLNISKALSVLFDFVNEANKKDLSKKSAGEALEFLVKVNEVLAVMDFSEEKIPGKVEKLVNQRDEARKNKDWEKADKLREQIKKLGYRVDDKEGKTIIKKV